MKKILLLIIGIIVTTLITIDLVFSLKPEWFLKDLIEYNQDEIVVYKDVEYSINEILKTIEYNDIIATENKEILIVKLNINNKSEKNIDLNHIRFELNDADSNAKYRQISPDELYDNVNPDEKEQIKLMFEVDEKSENVYLSYYKSGSKRVIFKYLISIY